MTDPQEIFPAPPTTVETPWEPLPNDPSSTGAFNPDLTPQEWADQQFPDTDKGVTG